MEEKKKIKVPIENRKVPCNINQGELCDMPFCKYIFYGELRQKYFDEWQNAIKKELEEYKKAKP